MIAAGVPGSLRLLYENGLGQYGRHGDSSQEAAMVAPIRDDGALGWGALSIWHPLMGVAEESI